MLQVHFIAEIVTIWSFFLNIQVSCWFPNPLYSRWCHDYTRRETHAGVLEDGAGHQPRHNGNVTSQAAPWYSAATPHPVSEKRWVSSPRIRKMYLVKL